MDFSASYEYILLLDAIGSDIIQCSLCQKNITLFEFPNHLETWHFSNIDPLRQCFWCFGCYRLNVKDRMDSKYQHLLDCVKRFRTCNLVKPFPRKFREPDFHKSIKSSNDVPSDSSYEIMSPVIFDSSDPKQLYENIGPLNKVPSDDSSDPKQLYENIGPWNKVPSDDSNELQLYKQMSPSKYIPSDPKQLYENIGPLNKVLSDDSHELQLYKQMSPVIFDSRKPQENIGPLNKVSSDDSDDPSKHLYETIAPEVFDPLNKVPSDDSDDPSKHLYETIAPENIGPLNKVPSDDSDDPESNVATCSIKPSFYDRLSIILKEKNEKVKHFNTLALHIGAFDCIVSKNKDGQWHLKNCRGYCRCIHIINNPEKYFVLHHDSIVKIRGKGWHFENSCLWARMMLGKERQFVYGMETICECMKRFTPDIGETVNVTTLKRD